MRRKEIITLVSLLFFIGGVIFAYRAIILEFPLKPNQSVTSWHVEAKLSLNGQNNPARLNVFLPRESDRYTIVDENFISDGFGMTSTRDENTGNRVATWTKRNAGTREILYYRAILYQARASSANEDRQNLILREPQYGSEEFNTLRQEGTHFFALGNVIEYLQDRSADHESFALELFKLMRDSPNASHLVQLREETDTARTPAALAVYILRHAGIPARVMNGLPFAEAVRNARLESWAEVYIDGQWKAYDSENNRLRVFNDRLNWWIGSVPFYETERNLNASMQVSVKKHVENAITEAMWRGSPTQEIFYKMSAFNLPVDLQIVFSILLLLPLGALVVSIARQIIGIHTFGTFMPILVALAFRETQLLWGVFLFTFITGLGLVFRGYLNRLQLLMVPRLSAIMILVVITIYLITVIAFNMNFQIALSISLFPLVILTMLIERMSMTWEEFGAMTALQSAFGSLIVAILGYLVMYNALLSYLVISFPELLLIVLAITILIGRYNGYKLSEYYRFRKLARLKDNKGA